MSTGRSSWIVRPSLWVGGGSCCGRRGRFPGSRRRRRPRSEWAYDACGQEAGITADDESGQGLVTDGSQGVYRLGGFGEAPPVDAVGGCFDVAAQDFGCCLLFDILQDFPEAVMLRSWRKSAMASQGRSPTCGKTIGTAYPRSFQLSSLNRWAATWWDLRGEAGVEVTKCSPTRYLAVLQLAEDQSEYVASILSRRATLLELMWDLDNTPLCRGMSPYGRDPPA
jgi:hypothetical protein